MGDEAVRPRVCRPVWDMTTIRQFLGHLCCSCIFYLSSVLFCREEPHLTNRRLLALLLWFLLTPCWCCLSRQFLLPLSRWNRKTVFYGRRVLRQIELVMSKAVDVVQGCRGKALLRLLDKMILLPHPYPMIP